MRPRFLDRIGVDDRFLIVLSLLFALVIGCEIPPGPTPDPINPPVPVPTPVVEGSRVALILHESHDQTPQFARLKTDLQGGQAAIYFAAKHHTCYVLDIDAKDENKQPLAVIQRLKPTIGNKPLPVLVVGEKAADGKLGKVLYCESISGEAVGNDVVEVVKKHGG